MNELKEVGTAIAEILSSFDRATAPDSHKGKKISKREWIGIGVAVVGKVGKLHMIDDAYIQAIDMNAAEKAEFIEHMEKSLDLRDDNKAKIAELAVDWVLATGRLAIHLRS